MAKHPVATDDASYGKDASTLVNFFALRSRNGAQVWLTPHSPAPSFV
jgi:hypothetical protein